jgi:wobble nucleotide-excising tRNase
VRERAEKAEKAEADRRRREHATLALEAAREALRAKGRAQEAALAAELKAIKIQNSFLGASKDAIEAASFAGQTAGARREADVLQSAAKQSSLRAEEIQAKEVRRRRGGGGGWGGNRRARG